MTKNDLMSLLELNAPLDYPILTTLVSFVLLCASFEAGLIHSFGTFALTDIDNVSIMKSSFMKPHTEKNEESPATATKNVLPSVEVKPHHIPTLAV